MAGSLNKVILIGHLGRDPEIRTTNDGKEIVHFNLATSDTWKDKATGERRENTEWHRVVVFSDGLVGIIKKYLKIGSKIYIEGKLRTRKWTDPEGKERYTTEIILQNFESTLILLDSRHTSDAISDGAPLSSQSPRPVTNFDHNELDDEIPF